VPWCEDCARYRTPNSVNDDGSCPTCGVVLQLPDGSEAKVAADSVSVTDDEKSPWHFKLMVFTVTVYLAWRLLQFVI